MASDDRIQLIRKRFIASLEATVIEFNELHQQLKKQEFNADEIINLHIKSHKIAGTAETFGFRELGAQARQVEIYLNKLIINIFQTEILQQLSNAIELFLIEANNAISVFSKERS